MKFQILFSGKNKKYINNLSSAELAKSGVVGWCEGAVYLTSLGLQLILAYS